MRSSAHPRIDRRALGVALAASACTALTHAGDYQTQVQDDVCTACPANVPLRRPPCPSADTPPSSAATVTYFALRTLDFGEESAEWSDPARVVGLDLDCSDRVASRGAPALCTFPLSFDWVQVPLGVDNTFGVDLLGQFASIPSLGVHPSAGANEDLAQGAWGIVLAIDGWNGLADDGSVGVRMLSARGVSGGGAPRWDGTDRWDVYSPGVDAALASLGVPDATFKGGSAYVAGGVLVWDARSIEGASLRFANHGASLDENIEGALFTGTLAKSGVTGATLAGVFPATSYHTPYSFLAGCDASTACAAATSATIDTLLADMPAPGEATSPQCNAISFGVAMELGAIAGPGALIVDAPVDGPCDLLVPCEAMDASAD